MLDRNDPAKFIEGEMIDLCLPDENTVSEGWAQWFNDPKVTRWLTQGAFPNTERLQLEFLEDLKTRRRLALMIRAKNRELIGTVSLSTIDMQLRSAQISIVIGKPQSPKKLITLEAMALMTEHAFEKMGLERVWACQPYPAHAGFNRSLELIGFWAEGILRNSFRKGRVVSDAVMISCLLDDYARILKHRARLWGGNDVMLDLVRQQKDSLSDAINGMIAAERAKRQAMISVAVK